MENVYPKGCLLGSANIFPGEYSAAGVGPSGFFWRRRNTLKAEGIEKRSTTE